MGARSEAEIVHQMLADVRATVPLLAANAAATERQRKPVDANIEAIIGTNCSASSCPGATAAMSCRSVHLLTLG